MEQKTDVSNLLQTIFASVENEDQNQNGGQQGRDKFWKELTSLNYFTNQIEKLTIKLTNYVFEAVVVQERINQIKIASKLDKILEKIDELRKAKASVDKKRRFPGDIVHIFDCADSFEHPVIKVHVSGNNFAVIEFSQLHDLVEFLFHCAKAWGKQVDVESVLQVTKAAESQRRYQHPPNQWPVIDRVNLCDDCDFDRGRQNQANNNFSRSCLQKATFDLIVVLNDIAHHVVNQVHTLPDFNKILSNINRLDDSHNMRQG